jgi:hypothetical protein
MRPQEVAFVGLFVVLFGAVLFLDRVVPDHRSSTKTDEAGAFVSTGWYCPAPNGEDLEALMSTANLGRSPLAVRQLSVGEKQESDFAQARVEALHRRSIPLRQFNIPNAVGVTDAFGENSTAALTVRGRGKGFASSECSPQPWDRWYFASASTVRGEDHYLLVANPFREEAVVKVRLLMPDKDVVPARLKDLVVPTLSQTAVYLPDYYVENPSFGVELTATTGRVIVSRYSAVNRGGVRGLSLDLGVREPAANWHFAGGEVPQNGEEELILVNPGDREALVEITFPTDSDQVAPQDLSELPVEGGRQVTVDVSDHLPRGTKHGVVVTSSNSVPLVVERRITAPVEGGRGIDMVFGVPRASQRWVVPVGSDVGGFSSLAITNPGGGEATVRVSLISDDGPARPPELAALTVEAGRRETVDLTNLLRREMATAVVEATNGAIAVESQAVLGDPYSDFAFTAGEPVAAGGRP